MNHSVEEDTMREEYDFSGGVRGKHYKLLGNTKPGFPLFESVIALDEAIRECFPRDFGGGLEWLGLIFSELTQLKNYGYYCTPTNTLAFARTGMDGEHFSFLVGEDGVNERSPIICTAPAYYNDNPTDSCNVVVAENFLMFVRLWLRFGGYALVELVCNREQALEVYTTADWKPVEQSLRPPDYLRFDYIPDDETQAVLDFALDALDLQPYIYTVDEFLALQVRYMSQLELPEDYKEDLRANELWILEQAKAKETRKQAKAKAKLTRSPDPAAE
jgi:hypothetical protein